MAERMEVQGVVLDRRISFSIAELCSACAVKEELLIEMVYEGVIDAEGGKPEDWRFRGEALVRARRAIRLVRDLRVNWPGAALALDLLDELEKLKSG